MTKLIISCVINFLVFLIMAVVFVSYRKDEEGKISAANIKRSLVFFTTLSNLFSALISLIVALVEVSLILKGETLIPHGIILLKFVGTAAVSVTLLTVLVFLGPTQGYGNMFKRDGIYVHLIGPLMSIFSLCLLETSSRISFSESLLGILPMLFYGIYYLRQVVLIGEEKGGWADFYGFNHNGKWKISFSAMVIGTFIICVLLYFFHNTFVS